MATKDPAESIGEFFATLVQIVFNPTFPLTVVTLCGASFVLAFVLHAPEFALWPALAMGAVDYAKANAWAAIALSVFVLGALPLAWISLREREVQYSKAVLEWVVTALGFAFIFWLHTAWAYNESGWQAIVYAFLLFFAWNGVVEASLSTLVIVLYVRRNRPKPVAPPRQEPHGASTSERRGRDEPETI